MKLPIPPHLQQQLLESTSTIRHATVEAFRPLVHLASRHLSQALARRNTTAIGSVFRNLCFVGLNRTELLFGGETQGVFGDSWQELVDESMKRHMALIFFAPRGLDGEPVNPYLFLAGEQLGSDGSDAIDPASYALAQQFIGNVPLIDLCRMSPAAPNTLNILVAADTLFHWDVKDNYVLPTTPASWARDVDRILKEYPRTTQAIIYTQWDADLIPTSDRITVRSLRDLPLDPNTWINKPTVQEAYGNHVLILGLIMAALATMVIYWRQQSIDELNEQLRVIEQQIPRGGRFGDMERAVREQEKMMQKRELFYLAVKDTAQTLDTSRMKAENFEIRVPDVQAVPDQYLVTIEAAKDAYSGWLQEEPIAKAVLANSVMLDGVRKPPASSFKIEGLINLDRVWKDYAALAKGKSVLNRSTAAQPATGGQATTVISTEDAAEEE